MITRTTAGLLESDNFDRPDNGTPGGNWTTDTGTVEIASNRMKCHGASRPGAYNSAVAARAENFTQVIWRFDNTSFLPFHAHHQGAGDRDGYALWISGFNGSLTLYQVVGGATFNVLDGDFLSTTTNTNYTSQLYTANGIQEGWGTGIGSPVTVNGSDTVYNGGKIPFLYRSGSGSSSSAAFYDDFLWMRSKNIIVTGLLSGYKAKIVNSGGSVIAQATESGGTATIDASRFGGATEVVPFAGWTKLRITDGADVTIEEYTDTGVYPGDEYDYEFFSGLSINVFDAINAIEFAFPDVGDRRIEQITVAEFVAITFGGALRRIVADSISVQESRLRTTQAPYRLTVTQAITVQEFVKAQMYIGGGLAVRVHEAISAAENPFFIGRAVINGGPDLTQTTIGPNPGVPAAQTGFGGDYWVDGV